MRTRPLITMDTKQEAERLRALWKSGRDKYASFFHVFSDVRKEVGDANLADWCYRELRISLDIVLMAGKTLTKIDGERVKAEFAAANKVENEKRAAAALAKRKAREDEAFARAKEKAERACAFAAIRAEQARHDAERKKAADTEKRRQQKQSNPNERGPKAGARARKREILSHVSSADLADLVKRWNDADKMCQSGIDRWIEGSIAKAKVLCAAREKFAADQDFGAWLDQNGIDLSHQNRAALIGLGRMEERRLREILTATESRSYELIWREHKPTLSVVEN